ncbi:MAG: glycosyltransferase family 2 protein [Candidatus Binatia bacterium]
MPVFSLGVLAHDEEGSIERMLRSVVRQSAWRALPAARREVVVYANACTDATADRVRAVAAEFPEIRIVETAEQGKSQGWNALQAHLRSDAEWWFFADADVMLHWRAVERLFAAGRAHPEAAVLSATVVASARFVPIRYRGFLESVRVESERLKEQRRMVSARFYAIRRDVAQGIRLPPGLLNEDLYLTRLLGSERIWRSPEARVFAREPRQVRDIVRYQVRTRIGSFQARRMEGKRVDSNKSAAALVQRAGTYRKLSWKAKVGKLLWIPLKLYVEWQARRVPQESLGESFWMKIGSAKLEGVGRRRRGA